MRRFNFLLTNKSSHFSNEKQTQIELLLSYLQSGLSYDQCKDLIDVQSETLEEYVQSFAAENQFNVLKEYLSFQDMLIYVYEVKSFTKKLKQQVFKILAYPSLLYGLMYLLMLFFISVLLPSLLNIIMLFDLETQTIKILSLILKGVFYALTALNIMLVLLLLSHRKIERVKLTMIKASRKKRYAILKQIYSYQFAHLFLLLIKRGFSTNQALHIMRLSSSTPLTSWIATLIVYDLETGASFESSIDTELLDYSFRSLCKIGVVNNKIIELLDAYLNTAFNQIQIKINRIGSMLKTVTYLLLGFLILFLYQILLAPMSIMGQL